MSVRIFCLSKMVNFVWNIFLANAVGKVYTITDCKLIDPQNELSKLKVGYKELFTDALEAKV